MKCPNCGLVDNDGRVIDSRRVNNTVRRRRACSHCDVEYRTYEVTESDYFTPRNTKKRKYWTTEEELNLVRLHNDRVKKSEIGRMLGRSRMSIIRKLDRLIEDGKYLEYLSEVEEGF